MSSRLRSIPARLALAATVLAAALSLNLLPALGQGVTQKISSRQSRAAALRAAVAAESARIASTDSGLADAGARLAALQADVDRRLAQQRRVQSDIVKARIRLERLENSMQRSTEALQDNLVQAYQSPRPDLVSVVLNAHSFADLLEQGEFLKRIANRDAQILAQARRTRGQVEIEANSLVRLQLRVAKLAKAVARRRDQADAVRDALLSKRATLQARLNGKTSELAAIREQITALRARQRREAARAARLQRQAAVKGIALDVGGFAQAPPGAPDAVRKVIAAGNAIAGLPYLYGGGHASFQASAYDCSGSISYALAAAGLVTSPMTSGAFESWGEPGPGSWITVYANGGHAWMIVAGWRFDTSALSGGGTRWTRQTRGTAGFVLRHPPGL